MLPRNLVVQGVDALEDDDFIFFQLQRLGRLEHAHLTGELVLRHTDALAACEGGKVLVQKVHVEALRALVVYLPRARAGSRGGVDGAEIVVHTYCIGVYPAAVELGLYFLGSGGLAAAARAGEQHYRAALQVGAYHVRRQRDLRGVARVALGHERGRVGHGAVVYLLEVKRHGTPQSFPCPRRPCRSRLCIPRDISGRSAARACLPGR